MWIKLVNLFVEQMAVKGAKSRPQHRKYLVQKIMANRDPHTPKKEQDDEKKNIGELIRCVALSMGC